MENTCARINDMIDTAIVANPGQFPDGPDFWNVCEGFLQGLVSDGIVDQWKVDPRTDDGFRVMFEKDGNSYTVIRNPDGGRQQ